MDTPAGPLRLLPRRVAVAIPVRDEAERIVGCLRALAAQSGVAHVTVVLLLNNCRDATASLVRALAPSLPLRIDLREVDLPQGQAHAGVARSLAMQRAAGLAGPEGVVLTTDADSVAPVGWLAANLAAIAAGADAVAGRAVIDPVEAQAIPDALHAADARECAYATLLDEIASVLDPEPHDPWPRHDEASGASLAVTVAAWRRVGGMAPLPSGEDRGFVERLRRHDCRIRHAPDVWVRVSGRIEGRAPGGMADTIRRRMTTADLFLDDRLEPVRHAARRAALRRIAREAWTTADVERLARALSLPRETVGQALTAAHFGAAWARMEAASPVLGRRRVPVSRLAEETLEAQLLRDRLVGRSRRAGATPPADSLAEAAD